MTTGGFSPKRLARARDVLERYVSAGYVPGAVAVIARHGEVHIEATGNLACEGDGYCSRPPEFEDLAANLTPESRALPVQNIAARHVHSQGPAHDQRQAQKVTARTKRLIWSG